MPKQINLSVLLLIILILTACGPSLPTALQATATPAAVIEGPVQENAPQVVTAGESDLIGTLPVGTGPRTLTALGDPNAPVVMVEYSDFQCPFCRRYTVETMPLLKANYIDTGRVYYVFKDFPIASLHPLAYRLHEAALCVGNVSGTEAYWQVHDLFFDKVEAFQVNSVAEMDTAVLSQIEQLSLPVAEIQDCLVNGRYAAEVQGYISEGQSLGVSGTPSFFINGNSFVGARPYSDFQTLIDQAEKGEIVAAAPPAADVPAPAPTPAIIPVRELSALGDPNAPVTIIEYSDYNCPFCQRHVLETMPQIKANYIESGDVYYVFKDFPIANLHPLAYRLHEAALCVGQMGDAEMYWQAHDLFFENATTFQLDSLEALDAAILAEFSAAGLPDVAACLASNANAELVQAGIAEGRTLGVNGTPAFFVNGYPVTGAQPYELFEYVIDLAKDGGLKEAFEQTGPTDGKAQATAQAAQPMNVPLNDEPSKGAPDAPIIIVEYSDYQCPFCLRYFQQTLPLIQQYIDSGQVRYVFKDFPIHSIHPQAQKAHEAARCARELGGDDAYWMMHDLLFTNQQTWAGQPLPQHEQTLKDLAPAVGLPQAEFDACLDEGRYYDAVNAEVNEGVQLGIRGTPSFFINGQPLVGAQPFATFQQTIEGLLSANE